MSRALSRLSQLSSATSPHCSRPLSVSAALRMPGDRASHILDTVTELVQRHALVADKYDAANKVVQFEHPRDLFSVLPLDIGREGTDDQELEKIGEAVVQYSVKTCHPYFYNQLYHGVDEYGLAGSWLSDALNTNIHTFEVAPAFIAIEHSLLAYIRQLFGGAADQVDSLNKI